MDVEIKDVSRYWEKFPAGQGQLADLDNDLERLRERDRLTDLLSPHIEEKYRMSLANGKRTLDLGCGQGYNAQKLVANGAHLTAIDLTTRGLELASFRFSVNNLRADFVRASAEALPFSDDVFEFVHSSGVIHHTPDIKAAVEEIYRVMKPGALASIMIYNRRSINYWYRLSVKLRLKMILLYLMPDKVLNKILAAKPSLENYIPNRWPNTRDVLNAGTDFGGVHNPLSRVYSREQAASLFSDFIIEGFSCSGGVYKPLKNQKNIFDRLVGSLHDVVMRRFGWYLFVYLKKAES